LRVLQILLSNSVLVKKVTESKQDGMQRENSHIENFLGCRCDFLHFVLGGLCERVRRQAAGQREADKCTFKVPPVARALLAAKSLAAE
jgi:hypothetical protein